MLTAKRGLGDWNLYARCAAKWLSSTADDNDEDEDNDDNIVDTSHKCFSKVKESFVWVVDIAMAIL